MRSWPLAILEMKTILTAQYKSYNLWQTHITKDKEITVSIYNRIELHTETGNINYLAARKEITKTH